MPRPEKPPRLHLQRRKGRRPVWQIRDGARYISTGCGEGERERAETALAEFIATKYRAPDGPRSAKALSVAEILTIYANEHAPTVADPSRVGYAIDALLPFWGRRSVSEIRGATCRRYARDRAAAASTARRELSVLRAAVNYAAREGYLRDTPPAFELPPSAKPRDRWLTRDEAGRLLDAARAVPHLYRFVRLGLATGSRADVMRALEWGPSLVGGHVDLDAKLLYRKSAAARETKKRAPSIRLDPLLVDEMKAWRADSRRWVVEYVGRRVTTIRNSWRAARERAELEADVTPHTLRHTAITWAMQANTPAAEACAYFGVTLQELQRTYWHHRSDVGEALWSALRATETAKPEPKPERGK